MAEGAGEVLRPGGGGRIAGAEPEVDGALARAGPQGTAETAKYTKNEQKETRTSTRRMKKSSKSRHEAPKRCMAPLHTMTMNIFHSYA